MESKMASATTMESLVVKWTALRESVDCVICLGRLRRPVATICGHTFCGACVDKTLEAAASNAGGVRGRGAFCPLCKTPLHKRSIRETERARCIVEAVQRVADFAKETVKASFPTAFVADACVMTSASLTCVDDSDVNSSVAVAPRRGFRNQSARTISSRVYIDEAFQKEQICLNTSSSEDVSSVDDDRRNNRRLSSPPPSTRRTTLKSRDQSDYQAQQGGESCSTSSLDRRRKSALSLSRSILPLKRASHHPDSPWLNSSKANTKRENCERMNERTSLDSSVHISDESDDDQRRKNKRLTEKVAQTKEQRPTTLRRALMEDKNATNKRTSKSIDKTSDSPWNRSLFRQSKELAKRQLPNFDEYSFISSCSQSSPESSSVKRKLLTASQRRLHRVSTKPRRRGDVAGLQQTAQKIKEAYLERARQKREAKRASRNLSEDAIGVRGVAGVSVAEYSGAAGVNYGLEKVGKSAGGQEVSLIEKDEMPRDVFSDGGEEVPATTDEEGGGRVVKGPSSRDRAGSSRLLHRNVRSKTGNSSFRPRRIPSKTRVAESDSDSVSIHSVPSVESLAPKDEEEQNGFLLSPSQPYWLKRNVTGKQEGSEVLLSNNQNNNNNNNNSNNNSNNINNNSNKNSNNNNKNSNNNNKNSNNNSKKNSNNNNSKNNNNNNNEALPQYLFTLNDIPKTPMLSPLIPTMVKKITPKFSLKSAKPTIAGISASPPPSVKEVHHVPTTPISAGDAVKSCLRLTPASGSAKGVRFGPGVKAVSADDSILGGDRGGVGAGEEARKKRKDDCMALLFSDGGSDSDSVLPTPGSETALTRMRARMKENGAVPTTASGGTIKIRRLSRSRSSTTTIFAPPGNQHVDELEALRSAIGVEAVIPSPGRPIVDEKDTTNKSLVSESSRTSLVESSNIDVRGTTASVVSQPILPVPTSARVSHDIAKNTLDAGAIIDSDDDKVVPDSLEDDVVPTDEETKVPRPVDDLVAGGNSPKLPSDVEVDASGQPLDDPLTVPDKLNRVSDSHVSEIINAEIPNCNEGVKTSAGLIVSEVPNDGQLAFQSNASAMCEAPITVIVNEGDDFENEYLTHRFSQNCDDCDDLDGEGFDGKVLDGEVLDGEALDGKALDGKALDGEALDGKALDDAALNAATLDGAALVGAALDGVALDGGPLRTDGVNDIDPNLVSDQVDESTALEMLKEFAEDGETMEVGVNVDESNKGNIDNGVVVRLPEHGVAAEKEVIDGNVETASRVVAEAEPSTSAERKSATFELDGKSSKSPPQEVFTPVSLENLKALEAVDNDMELSKPNEDLTHTNQGLCAGPSNKVNPVDVRDGVIDVTEENTMEFLANLSFTPSSRKCFTLEEAKPIGGVLFNDTEAQKGAISDCASNEINNNNNGTPITTTTNNEDDIQEFQLCDNASFQAAVGNVNGSSERHSVSTTGAGDAESMDIYDKFELCSAEVDEMFRPFEEAATKSAPKVEPDRSPNVSDDDVEAALDKSFSQIEAENVVEISATSPPSPQEPPTQYYPPPSPEPETLPEYHLCSADFGSPFSPGEESSSRVNERSQKTSVHTTKLQKIGKEEEIDSDSSFVAFLDDGRSRGIAVETAVSEEPRDAVFELCDLSSNAMTDPTAGTSSSIGRKSLVDVDVDPFVEDDDDFVLPSPRRKEPHVGAVLPQPPHIDQKKSSHDAKDDIDQREDVDELPSSLDPNASSSIFKPRRIASRKNLKSSANEFALCSSEASRVVISTDSPSRAEKFDLCSAVSSKATGSPAGARDAPSKTPDLPSNVSDNSFRSPIVNVAVHASKNSPLDRFDLCSNASKARPSPPLSGRVQPPKTPELFSNAVSKLGTSRVNTSKNSPLNQFDLCSNASKGQPSPRPSGKGQPPKTPELFSNAVSKLGTSHVHASKNSPFNRFDLCSNASKAQPSPPLSGRGQLPKTPELFSNAVSKLGTSGASAVSPSNCASSSSEDWTSSSRPKDSKYPAASPSQEAMLLEPFLDEDEDTDLAERIKRRGRRNATKAGPSQEVIGSSQDVSRKSLTPKSSSKLFRETASLTTGNRVNSTKRGPKDKVESAIASPEIVQMNATNDVQEDQRVETTDDGKAEYVLCSASGGEDDERKGVDTVDGGEICEETPVEAIGTESALPIDKKYDNVLIQSKKFSVHPSTSARVRCSQKEDGEENDDDDDDDDDDESFEYSTAKLREIQREMAEIRRKLGDDGEDDEEPPASKSFLDGNEVREIDRLPDVQTPQKTGLLTAVEFLTPKSKRSSVSQPSPRSSLRDQLLDEMRSMQKPWTSPSSTKRIASKPTDENMIITPSTTALPKSRPNNNDDDDASTSHPTTPISKHPPASSNFSPSPPKPVSASQLREWSEKSMEEDTEYGSALANCRSLLSRLKGVKRDILSGAYDNEDAVVPEEKVVAEEDGSQKFPSVKKSTVVSKFFSVESKSPSSVGGSHSFPGDRPGPSGSSRVSDAAHRRNASTQRLSARKTLPSLPFSPVTPKRRRIDDNDNDDDDDSVVVPDTPDNNDNDDSPLRPIENFFSVKKRRVRCSGGKARKSLELSVRKDSSDADDGEGSQPVRIDDASLDILARPPSSPHAHDVSGRQFPDISDDFVYDDDDDSFIEDDLRPSQKRKGKKSKKTEGRKRPMALDFIY